MGAVSMSGGGGVTVNGRMTSTIIELFAVQSGGKKNVHSELALYYSYYGCAASLPGTQAIDRPTHQRSERMTGPRERPGINSPNSFASNLKYEKKV